MGADLVGDTREVETAVDGVVDAGIGYDRGGLYISLERDEDRLRQVTQALESSPWFDVQQSMDGLLPLLLPDSPAPRKSIFGIGIATSKGMCSEAPLELLAMVAQHVVFNSAMQMPTAYALLATDIGFKAGALGSYHDYGNKDRLESIICTVMARAAHELHQGAIAAPGGPPPVELRWILDATLLKLPGLEDKAGSFRKQYNVPEGANPHFYNYLSYQNAYVQAFLEGTVFDPKYDGPQQATVKGGWHVGARDFKGTEVTFDKLCRGLAKMGFFYGKSGIRVAPGDPRKYRPPYGHYPKDDYVIPLLTEQNELLERLLSGISNPPKEYRARAANELRKLWTSDYCIWTESLVQVCDLIAQAFPTVRIEFAEIAGRDGAVTRAQLVESGPASVEWRDLVEKSEGGKKQSIMTKIRDLQTEYEDLKVRYLVPRISAILARFGATA